MSLLVTRGIVNTPVSVTSIASIKSISFVSIVCVSSMVVSFISTVSTPVMYVSSMIVSSVSTMVTSISSVVLYCLSLSSSRAVILHMSFYSAIIVVILISRPRNSPSCPAGPGSLLGRSRPGQGPHCPSPSWDRIWTDCQRLPGPLGPGRAPH